MVAENARIQQTLHEWDLLMTKMITEHKKEKESSAKQQLIIQASIDKHAEDRAQKEKEFDALKQKYKQMRLDYEDCKEVPI